MSCDWTGTRTCRNTRGLISPLISSSAIPFLSPHSRSEIAGSHHPAYCSKTCHNPNRSESVPVSHVSRAGNVKESAMGLSLAALALNGAMTATTDVAHDRGTMLPNSLQGESSQTQRLHSTLIQWIHMGWIVDCGQTPVLHLFGGWA
jgi:hypothetical protein